MVVNQYTIVVQEFFQKQFQSWLTTVGKEVFHLSHHFAKFKFAPMHGQIHVHLLGISEFWHVFEIYHVHNGSKPLQAEFLHLWAEKYLSYTCDVQN